MQPLFVLLCVVCSLCLREVLAYTAPSTKSKFRPVLARAKLQAPDSSTAAFDLFGYSSASFHLQGGTYMQFQMKGSSKRSELREMKTNGDKAAWSVESSNTLHAEIALPKPASGLDEITFLQVHSGASKPALRVSWRRSYKENGKTYSDCIISTLRDGLGSGDVHKKFLAQRHTGTKSYKIRVKNSKVSIWISGSRVLNEATMAFWKRYPTCYFKAGAYINKASSDTASARTKFKELDWS